MMIKRIRGAREDILEGYGATLLDTPYDVPAALARELIFNGRWTDDLGAPVEAISAPPAESVVLVQYVDGPDELILEGVGTVTRGSTIEVPLSVAQELTASGRFQAV